MDESPPTDTAASDHDAATPARRRRAPEERRAAIVEAARAAFAELGFGKTTIREVARRAGVTHGLVIRHFGSKEQLFLAAVPSPRTLMEEVAGDPRTLPTRVARSYVRRMAVSGGNDPFVALLRAVATDEETAKRLFAAMQEDSLEMYRHVIPGPKLEERVASVGAYLIGVTFSRYVFKSGPLASMPDEDLIRHLVPNLRMILLD
ncbi:TetR family transcriptional regulator [Streptomyces sp. S.PNR 29]|uniref:TetR/AcrR family transcriptional regulator n=1 Tax=Streptomyces sp. S.PNR 29 TaxID=2973805 RepID=UPI0025B124AC|nr:TetR family transcriptional regulator [Streptomyces sp. S.PNR 29]MDN0200767.1 TetR family transcriptional regulator [Streptomyces sp. S.PNR 29]